MILKDGFMGTSPTKGNNPELWNKLLDVLDERLQLGLLDKMRRVATYHFEDNLLIIEAGTDEDEQYLKKSTSLQQLVIFAEDATKVKEVRIKPRSE